MKFENFNEEQLKQSVYDLIQEATTATSVDSLRKTVVKISACLSLYGKKYLEKDPKPALLAVVSLFELVEAMSKAPEDFEDCLDEESLNNFKSNMLDVTKVFW